MRLPFYDVIDILRDCIPQIPQRLQGRGLRSQWAIPPLILRPEDHVFQGVDLAPFTEGIADRIPPETLWGIYEDLMMARGDITPAMIRKRVSKDLRMPQAVVDWFFPLRPGDSNNVGYMLRVLAYLLETQAGQELIGDVGFRDGALFAQYSEPLTLPEPVWDVATHHVGLPPRRVIDNSLSSFYRSCYTIDDPAARRWCLLALTLMYHRTNHLGRFTAYLYEGGGGKHKKARMAPGSLQAVQKLKDSILIEQHPARLIQDTLVTVGYHPDEVCRRIPSLRDYADDPWPPAEVLLTWTRELNNFGKKQDAE